MSAFTKEFAMALAEKTEGEGYRMFVVLGLRGDGEEADDVDVTVVGGDGPDDIDDLADVFEQLLDVLRQNIRFQKPMGSA